LKNLNKHTDRNSINTLFETEVVEALTKHFASENFEIIHEVPSMGQSVDVVLKKGRWLTFIEAKVRNWQKAIIQCKSHEIVADFICIAIATKNVSNKLVDFALLKGYGIIHYNYNENVCSVILKPKLNKNIWEPQRKILNDKIKIIKNNGHTTLDDIWHLR
jgi:hypothetical protein